MRYFYSIFILIILIGYSCKDKSTNINKTSEKELVPEKQTDISNPELSRLFAKAVHSFPKDSASLYKFYFEWNLTKDKEKQKKQIKRLDKLTSKESIEKYRKTRNELKPLLTRIVSSDTMSKNQVDSVVILYSNYDYFSGESLFSNYFQDNENYSLVWQTFRIMVKESERDTSFISGLIRLDNNIQTNAELAQEMQEFVVSAVKNNPIGFLKMYDNRTQADKSRFVDYVFIWDSPVKELVDRYSDISDNSKNDSLKRIADDLMKRLKNKY